MMYSDYEQSILFYRRSGKSYEGILTLAEEGQATTNAGVYKFNQHSEETGTIVCAPGSGQTSKMLTEVVRTVEEQMEADDETTGKELQTLLAKYDIHDSPQVADRATAR